MISVYELPGYNNQVEQAIGECHPAFKKKVELKNKIAKCTNKMCKPLKEVENGNTNTEGNN